MTMIDFRGLEDWKAFERLTADVLEAEGFRIIREPSVDKSGVDILAEETLASHSGAIQQIRWFVQCKHYSGSRKSVGRKEVEEILYAFSARAEHGLLIATDTAVTEEAARVLERATKSDQCVHLVKVWNRRELENRLLRHPGILRKYGLKPPNDSGRVVPFAGIRLLGRKILVVSDGSPFAYQLFTMLNAATDGVSLITVWQYNSPDRAEMLFRDTLATTFDLVVFFLGDSFGFPVPRVLTEKVLSTAEAGGAVLLFPFFAWALDQGWYKRLGPVMPVRLAKEPRRDQLRLKTSRIMSSGDLSPLNNESFVENQYVTVSAKGGHAALAGLPGEFELIHSFEFVELTPNAESLLSDTMGNPLLIQNMQYDSPVLYMNSCMHNCLTRSPLLSPFEQSAGYSRLVENVVLWSLRGSSNQPLQTDRPAASR